MRASRLCRVLHTPLTLTRRTSVHNAASHQFATSRPDGLWDRCRAARKRLRCLWHMSSLSGTDTTALVLALHMASNKIVNECHTTISTRPSHSSAMMPGRKDPCKCTASLIGLNCCPAAVLRRQQSQRTIQGDCPTCKVPEGMAPNPYLKGLRLGGIHLDESRRHARCTRVEHFNANKTSCGMGQKRSMAPTPAEPFPKQWRAGRSQRLTGTGCRMPRRCPPFLRCKSKIIEEASLNVIFVEQHGATEQQIHGLTSRVRRRSAARGG